MSEIAENADERSAESEEDSLDSTFTIKAPTEHARIRINKWRVREGYPVSAGQVILFYQSLQTDNSDATDKTIHKLKANRVGVVKKRICKEGDIVKRDTPIIIFVDCIHTTVIKDMCANCGADLRQNENGQLSEASVPMIHSMPDLKVTQKLAQKLGHDDTRRLLQDRKLVLLVDLDQTVIHTTNDNVPNNIKGIYHFQLYGPNSPWYHTRLRPGTPEFLEKMSKLYELHICTFGARNYAHMIAQLLDPEGKYFSHRILSRDECFNATSKTDNLRALFPNGDSMVCIIDDREDVWNMAPNLIQVKPYHFFQHTGDINAPPGLSKHELDGEGLDFKELDSISKDETAQNKNNAEQKTSEAAKDTVDAEPTITKVNKDNKADDAEKSPADEDKKANTKCEESDETPAGTPSSAPTINKQDSAPEEPAKDEIVKEAQTETEKDATDAAETKDDPSDATGSSSPVSPKIKLPKDPQKQIEIEDPDDYLLHLESILQTIHKRFYSIYDETHEIPDLKVIVPKIRSEVLRGQNLVFSGLVPTQMELEQSRAYFIAKSLGANVSQNIGAETTHLVAVTAGTFKVNAAKKNPKIKVVNANWLWTCAERWEHVDETLFQLDRKTKSKQRQPPAHCHSPEHVVNYSNKSEISSSSSAQQHNSFEPPKFLDTLNPLLVFSNDELADINEEFNEFFESDTSSEDEHINIENPPIDRLLRKRKREEKEEERTREFFTRTATDVVSTVENDDNDYSSGSSTSRSSDNEKKKAVDNEDEEEEEESEDEIPSEKFRRGEVPSDIDMNSDSDNTNSDNADSGDDGDWNMMGAALEREFLGLD